jgi:hypothetical protein
LGRLFGGLHYRLTKFKFVRSSHLIKFSQVVDGFASRFSSFD